MAVMVWPVRPVPSLSYVDPASVECNAKSLAPSAPASVVPPAQCSVADNMAAAMSDSAPVDASVCFKSNVAPSDETYTRAPGDAPSA